MYAHTTAIGRLTRDPVERTYGTDGKMALFTVAVDTGRDESQYYDCISFGGTAENILKYFTKGKPIIVSGHFQNNIQERTTPGGETYKEYGMNLLVRTFSFVNGDSQQGAQNNQQQAQRPQQPQQGGGQQQFQNQFGGQQPQQQQQQPQQNANPFAGFSGDKVPF